MTRRAAIAVIVGALSTPAHADTSYRWQLMVSDGVSNGLILTSASDRLTSSTHGVLAYLGVASYALGAPILHAAHDDWGTAGLSLGTRVALPALLGWGAHGACMHWGGRRGKFLPCYGAAAAGIIGGVLTAQFLDWTVLDHTDEPKTIMFQLGGGF